MGKHLVVIGGTAAGLSAASKAKRMDPDIKVSVYERTGFIAYGACGLPYYIGDLVKTEGKLADFTPDELKEKRDISTYIHHEVTKIDADSKTLDVYDLRKNEFFKVPYDYLVIATGASPIIPDIPHVHANGVFFLRTVEDGMAIKNAIKERNVKKALIVGGGFIGLEMAEQLSFLGIEVTIVEALPRLLPLLDEEYSNAVKKNLEENNVYLHTGTTVSEIISENGNVVGGKTNNGEIFDTDMAIVSIGVRPNSSMAQNAGLKTGIKNAIVVDEYMKTSDESIWACGDCVQTFNFITKRETYVPLGTTANKQGRIAGGNIAGDKSTFKGVLASQITKVFDLYIASTGLTVDQAREAGFLPEEAKIVKKDKASYYPGGKDNNIKLIFDKNTGRLLGAQAIGSESIAGRINLLATAITAGMTVAELSEVDLVYAPSVAPVYDPILIAASQAVKKVVLKRD